jgi:hypothetical protein
MGNLTAEERKALRTLCDAAEQQLDRGGPWPELEKALKVLGPVVYGKKYKGFGAQ